MCMLIMDEGDKLLEVGEQKFLEQVDAIIAASGKKHAAATAAAEDEEEEKDTDDDSDASGSAKKKKKKKKEKEEEKKKGKKSKKSKKGAEAEAKAEPAMVTQRCLFSATLPQNVEELARTFLRDPIRSATGNQPPPAAAGCTPARSTLCLAIICRESH